MWKVFQQIIILNIIYNIDLTIHYYSFHFFLSLSYFIHCTLKFVSFTSLLIFWRRRKYIFSIIYQNMCHKYKWSIKIKILIWNIIFHYYLKGNCVKLGSINLNKSQYNTLKLDVLVHKSELIS